MSRKRTGIRLVQKEDGAALRSIYAQYMDTPVTFEYRLPTVAEFTQRIARIMEEYPWLVWEEQGRAVGYAYAHRQMERQAYQWNAELSIYLDRSVCGRGIGKRLYRALLDLLCIQGIRNLYAGVTLPNERSENLHRTMGFHLLGIYRHTGWKCGAWHDVGWFEKELVPCDQVPAPLIPFRNLTREQIEKVLRCAVE